MSDQHDDESMIEQLQETIKDQARLIEELGRRLVFYVDIALDYGHDPDELAAAAM